MNPLNKKNFPCVGCDHWVKGVECSKGMFHEKCQENNKINYTSEIFFEEEILSKLKDIKNLKSFLNTIKEAIENAESFAPDTVSNFKLKLIETFIEQESTSQKALKSLWSVVNNDSCLKKIVYEQENSIVSIDYDENDNMCSCTKKSD